jgi:hypothetical protein
MNTGPLYALEAAFAQLSALREARRTIAGQG